MSDNAKAFAEGETQERPRDTATTADEAPAFTKGHRTRASRSKSAGPDLHGLNGNTQPDNDPDRENDDNEDSQKDDSEAETVLSSPVKRREASKKAGASSLQVEKSATSPTVKANGTISVGSHEYDHEAAASHASSPSSAKPSDHTSSVQQSHEKDPESNASKSPARARKTSDTPATRQSTSSPDAERATLENGHADGNPRKRKHRDSVGVPKSFDSATLKRQRRSSAQPGSGSGGSSDELSPPPQLRRHKRTMSNIEGDGNLDGRSTEQAQRSRRAVSHLTAKDQRLSLKQEWESDSDSEVSRDRAPQSRSGRNLNRSVSTPGRPLGRDHKRHVNKYGFTRLAEACESGDLDLVKEWREKDPEQLEQREFAGNTPLQIASLNGYPEIVSYLLQEGCNPHCANTDKDTPLIDAVENSHVEVVQVLLDAGVDPLRQNMKGQQALDVITEDLDNGSEMRDMLRKAIEHRRDKTSDTQAEEDEAHHHDRPGPKQGLHFMARTPDNLLKLVSNNDRKGVTEFLDARVPVDNSIVAAAARTGDIYLVNMLLAEMSPKKAKSKAEKPMLAVLGSSHFEMVKTLTELDQFNPTWRSKANGMTWHEMAENRLGPHWRQEKELLHQLYVEAQAANSLGSSPVHKMENGSRKPRSPTTSRDSDVDLDDDEDLPEVARIKRRLLSRKDMRAAQTRKSTSAASSRAQSPAVAISKEDDEEEEEEAPPPRRKPGRPRTKSISSSQPAEPKARKLKPIKESISMFEPSPGNLTKRRKPSTSSTSRPAIESVKSTVERSTSDQDAVMTDDKADEKAAEKSAEAERLAEQKAAEEKMAAEAAELAERNRRDIEERRIAREQKLAKLPDALRHVIQGSESNPERAIDFIARRFLPLQAVTGSAIGRESDDALYVLAYQAAGLLGGVAADQLLDLPSEKSLDQHDFGLDKIPVSPFHRSELLNVIGARNLMAPELNGLTNGADTDDMETIRTRVLQERAKFHGMEGLQWIKARDFLGLKAKLQIHHEDQYPHLKDLPPIQIHMDANVNEKASALPAVKTEVASPTPSAEGGAANGIASRSANGARRYAEPVDDELRREAGAGLNEGDGRVKGNRVFRSTTRADMLIAVHTVPVRTNL